MASLAARACGLLLQRTLVRRIRNPVGVQCGAHDHLGRCYGSEAPDGNKPDQGPLRYTDSGAEKWSTLQTFGDPNPVLRPWYERYVVGLSVAVFLCYFCILREENDLDADIAQPLYQRVPALERADLLAKIEEYRREGRDVKELSRRLHELKQSSVSSSSSS